jgi:hypothetical protein
MIDLFPAAVDALAQLFTAVLDSSKVFDGPTERWTGPSGIEIGSGLDDLTTAPSEFSADPDSLGGGYGETMTITCMAWAGGNSNTFKPYRDQVRDIMQAVSDAVVTNRNLGGVADVAELAGGTWTQILTDTGDRIVACDFRITVRKF